MQYDASAVTMGNPTGNIQVPFNHLARADVEDVCLKKENCVGYYAAQTSNGQTLFTASGLHPDVCSNSTYDSSITSITFHHKVACVDMDKSCPLFSFETCNKVGIQKEYMWKRCALSCNPACKQSRYQSIGMNYPINGKCTSKAGKDRFWGHGDITPPEMTTLADCFNRCKHNVPQDRDLDPPGGKVTLDCAAVSFFPRSGERGACTMHFGKLDSDYSCQAG
jgi:hypothetical protein